MKPAVILTFALCLATAAAFAQGNDSTTSSTPGRNGTAAGRGAEGSNTKASPQGQHRPDVGQETDEDSDQNAAVFDECRDISDAAERARCQNDVQEQSQEDPHAGDEDDEE